jgi:hypothetical protein
MTSTDEELVLFDILNDNWNKNVVKPVIIYEDLQKTVDNRFGAIRIYYVSSTQITPHGLGYTSKEVTHRLTLDVRASKRTQAQAIRDEIIRILDLKRVSPTSSYDFLTYSEGIKINNFVNNYRWTFDVFLKQLRRPTAGM